MRSFAKVLIYMNKTLSGRKVVAVAYESFSVITKFKSQFKLGFTKVVVTRADCLQEWWQGELQLYLLKQVYNLYR